MDRDELQTWLRLQRTPGIGNVTARKLLGALGLPAHIFQASEVALAQLTSSAQSASLRSVPADLDDAVATTWDWLQSAPDHRRVLPLGDPHYPASLLQCDDPPLLLYAIAPDWVWAQSRLAHNAARSIAMVGSRNPSAQGGENAQQFAKTFAGQGWTVVSGLALGVDGAAHAGALDGGDAEMIATIAVVGTGLDRVYPRQHKALAHRIAQHGVLLSEYPLGTPPLAENFPRRNRLIAGLSMGTLVVEAALQSGSLITARLALEQGKDVFAIPGSIHAPQSRGCHALIKQGAQLVESPRDVLEALGTPSPVAIDSIAAYAYSTGSECQNSSPLLESMGFDPVGLDALLARTGLDTPSLQAQLMAFELEGAIARLPGGLFQRMIRA